MDGSTRARMPRGQENPGPAARTAAELSPPEGKLGARRRGQQTSTSCSNGRAHPIWLGTHTRKVLREWDHTQGNVHLVGRKRW